MFFDFLLYGSLAVFTIGLAYKVHLWFSGHIVDSQTPLGMGKRLGQALAGILQTLFTPRVTALLRCLVLDIFFQRRILKESAYRWAMHMLIFWGFMLLILMHALDNCISSSLFDNYASTLNPYFFLRGMFGLMVAAGVVMAVYRRQRGRVPRLRTTAADRYALCIVGVVILSGFFLEGAKILSYSDFNRMVEEYADTDDTQELQALEAYWTKEMGVFSPNMNGPVEPGLMAQGLEIHETSCQGCHSASEWAFVGYGLSRVMRPVASFLEDISAANILWTIHILACFFGLAYLPFSKMFHIIATPLSLLSNAVTDPKGALSANAATRQMLALDACARCGTCSLRCSSVPAFEAMANAAILPSERLEMLRRLAGGKTLSDSEMKAVREGIIICTNCDRCTVVCPSGIDLRRLWVNVREDLVQGQAEGQPLMLSTFSFVRGLQKERIPADAYEKPLQAARQSIMDSWKSCCGPQDVPLTLDGKRGSGLDFFQSADSFLSCFGCQNCTTVCPVVARFETPQAALGLLPHQIMYSLGLGLLHHVCASEMLWACTTCYQCQEHCPQQVEVTDILYRLKVMALKGPSTTVGQRGPWQQAA